MQAGTLQESRPCHFVENKEKKTWFHSLSPFYICRILFHITPIKEALSLRSGGASEKGRPKEMEGSWNIGA